MKNHIVVREYKKIYKSNINDDSKPDQVKLNEDTYKRLCSFLQKRGLGIEYNSKTFYSDDKHYFGFAKFPKSDTEFVATKSLVGTILLSNGVIIELLPKINFGPDYDNTEASLNTTRRKLAEMLTETVPPIRKLIDNAMYGVFNIPLNEIGIYLYLKLIHQLVLHGIKYQYKTVNQNLNYYTGKLDIANQIKYNFAHGERFYVIYDDYLPDHAMNRLIKTALWHVLSVSQIYDNQTKARQLLGYFSEVEFSSNPKLDFSKKQLDRNYPMYDIAVNWSYAILQNYSYDPFFVGKYIDHSYLIPMENLFERYIASKVQEQCWIKKWGFAYQDQSYMFDIGPDGEKWQKIFSDIHLFANNKKSGHQIILDTKWKPLQVNKSQSRSLTSYYDVEPKDLYQMFMYAARFSSNNIWLIYPKSKALSLDSSLNFKTKIYDQEFMLHIFTVDMIETDESVAKLIAEIEKVI